MNCSWIFASIIFCNNLANGFNVCSSYTPTYIVVHLQYIISKRKATTRRARYQIYFIENLYMSQYRYLYNVFYYRYINLTCIVWMINTCTWAFKYILYFMPACLRLSTQNRYTLVAVKTKMTGSVLGLQGRMTWWTTKAYMLFNVL